MSMIGRESPIVSQHTNSEEVDLMTPEDQIRVAVNAQSKIVSELKMLDRKFKRLKEKSLDDLLDIDIDPQITSVTSLMQRHADLFQVIVELEPDEDVLTTATTSAEEVQDTYTDLLAGYKRLNRLREAYDSVLQARSATEDLLALASLTQSAEQDAISKLRQDLANITKVADSTNNQDLKDALKELRSNLTEIGNRNNEQLKMEDNSRHQPSGSDAKPEMVTVKSTLRLDLPTFDGNIIKWRDFWSLFSAILDKERGLTDSERCCHLINAMSTAEAKEQAKSAVAYTSNYMEATERLRGIYERNRVVSGNHFKALFATDTYDNSRKDLQRMKDKIEKHIRGLKQAEGYSADQMVVMHQEQCMSSKLVTAWRHHTYKETNSPNVPNLLQFLDRQLLAVPDEKPSSSSRVEKPSLQLQRTPTRRTVLKTQTVTVKCSVCKNDHLLYLCAGFKDKTPEQRMDLVRQNKLCFNCLSSKHMSSTCPSKKTYKDCGAKHHSLIHQTAPVGENTSTAGNVKLAQPGLCRTQNNIQSLARTALVLVSSDDQRRRARAILDTGATIPLITKKLANTLKANRIPELDDATALIRFNWN